MCILDLHYQCVVPIKGEKGVEAKVLSTIQFADGVRNDEASYLATSRVDEFIKPIEEISKEVVQWLKSFQDTMPAELLKKLPLKREENHEIELMFNIEPPTKAPR